MRQEPGRVMALDIGGRRIGVAVSDTTRVLALPLTTIPAVPRARAIKRIAELLDRNEVVELVIGLPLTLSGEIGPQAQEVQKFVEELRSSVTVPIHMFDERLTTVAAERMMIDMGVKPDQRKNRIDEVAASIILHDFLAAQGSPGDRDA